MNKIFKVIWNEARNAYVVVSEIAKNHGSKSCSTKKLLAMLIATGVMTCASFDVLAAEPAAKETNKSQYVAFKDDSPLLYDGKVKKFGGYNYIYDATNKYWVREGYVLTVDENGGKYTPLSQKDVRADVAYTRTGVPKGILQSVTSTVSASGTVTNMGESLNKITAGSFAGVSHAGGTEVEGSWDYIIKDASWEGEVDSSNYKDGYVNLYAGKTATAPKGFVNTDSKDLIWDDSRQAYFYKNQRVDYSNMYVINGKLGVFTNADSTKVYTGTVYGKNNEILMTVKDKDNNFYSYWAAEVTDPSATMATYRVEEYNKNLAKLVENDDALNRNDIKEVTLTKDTNSAIIGLVRNGGKAVDGAITVTSGGGTDGKDTFVKISNGTTEQTFATGSKVSVTKTADNKTTTITVDGQATIITDTDTHNELKSASLSGKTLTITGKDNGIAIDGNNGNAISVKLKEGENNLEVTEAGLELKKALTVNSVKAGEFYMSNAGIGYGGKAYITSSGLNANSQKITGVAAGTISEDSTDAVNGSQLNATNKKVDELNAEAGKHTTLVAGDNVTLVAKETDNGLEYTVTAKDTTYSAGDNVAIDKDNKISVDLSKYAKTEDVAVVYVDNNKNKSLHTTNSGAVGSNAIALGKDARAHENSVVIGDGAYTQGGFLTGYGYSVALGNNAVTGTKSTSVGYKAIGGRVGTITVGYNSYNGAAYGTVIGTESKINYSDQKTANAAATIVGAQSEIIADNKPYSGVANGIFGSANKIQNSNGITIQGSGNTVTDAYKDMDITPDEGLAILGGDYSVLSKKQSGAVAVIGGANTVSRQTDSTVIGYDNRLIGGEENISHDVFMAGSHNRLNNVSDSIVMGNKNTIENTIEGVSNVISFGHDNKIKASNAVAIGNGAGVSVEGGVALGVGSVASTAAGVLGYGAAEGETGIAWQATNGAVSVGSSVEDKKITRQITNVAAGTADTDAVNVAQLKKVSEAAASASQGWKLKTKKGNASDVKPGATVEFDGDANIQVGNVGNKVSVTLKNQLTGIQSITGEGAGSISFADGGKVKVNDVIIEKGGKITGVADGKISTDSTDAVNGSQLNAVATEAGKHTTLSNGKNTTVNPVTTADGHLEYKVDVNDELKDIKSITGEGAGSISFANDGIKFNNKVTIDKDGKITGVANGIADNDAVNVSQLNAVKETANKGWKLSTGKGKAVNVAPGETVDFSGDDNIKVSNTGKYVKVELEKNLTGLTSVTTNNAYVNNVDASKNESVTNVEYVKNQIADAALSAGNGISITDKKINVKLKDGEENLKVDETGLYLRKDLTGMESITGVGGGNISFSGGNVTINKITFNNDGRIQNVANGTENTDAVNFGQLQAVKNELIASDKDTHIDTSKEYNVGANNQIKLDVLDKDGKKLDQQVVINDVAKASDVGDVNNIASDIKNKEGKTTVVDAVNNLNNKVGDLNYVEGGKGNYVTNGETTTTSIGKLDQALKDVAATAAKHTTVTQGDNITVTPGTNTDGSKNYNVALKKDITVESVTANTFKADQTVMDKDGLKVGDKVSVSATAVTAGQTSISDEGLAVGPNTSLKADELKVDGKTYIDKNGLNANGMQITNVADGKENSDAVNVGQLKESEKTINNRINGVENEVISNSNRINQLGNRVNKVGAGAAALAALHPMDFDPDDKLTFSAGYGNYGGENAAAIGAYYRPDEKVMFSVGGTVGNGENMVNAGVSFALDRTNHVSNSRTALAREVIDLRGQLAVMGAKMAKMEKALGMLDETKTKLFPDIPANHWAYEYIAKLAGNGYIEGYPDGNFGGDRLMTRYEFAAMLYRAIENGAALEEKIIKEFEPELGRIRVDRISGEDGDRDKIERVRVNDTKGERDHYGNKLAK